MILDARKSQDSDFLHEMNEVLGEVRLVTMKRSTCNSTLLHSDYLAFMISFSHSGYGTFFNIGLVDA